MTQKQLLRHADNSNFCEHILGYDENLLEKIEEYWDMERSEKFTCFLAKIRVFAEKSFKNRKIIRKKAQIRIEVRIKRSFA